ncbi:LD-carboxypeptidase [Egicoccus sp. AB-alg6-2]|uniref:LD-carboxypeptidase n=1 Tax=Egicoccus sp. AB-alg6-2 TaxID=3242692 RepID=UPI00359CCE2F
MIKPRRLRTGDRLAAVSLSWGGPGAFPQRYADGKRQLEEAFGVEVVEMPHTLADPAELAGDPKARADDLHRAFADPKIAGVVATIGGDDSIRLLPFLDLDLLAANPKVLLGYSDTTITHLALRRVGITSFYGPAVMAGFAENGGLHRYLVDGVRRTLFEPEAQLVWPENDDGWTVEHLDWGDASNQRRRRRLQPATGWRWHAASRAKANRWSPVSRCWTGCTAPRGGLRSQARC